MLAPSSTMTADSRRTKIFMSTSCSSIGSVAKTAPGCAGRQPNHPCDLAARADQIGRRATAEASDTFH